MNLTSREVIVSSALVQLLFLVLLTALGVPIAQHDAVVVYSNVIGGGLVGAFLSCIPVGCAWDDVGYTWYDGAGYGGVASTAAAGAYFALLAVYNLTLTLHLHGVFAPQIILSIEFTVGLVYALVALCVGFVTGAISFVASGVFSRLFSERFEEP